jgi:hypothetical protein
MDNETDITPLPLAPTEPVLDCCAATVQATCCEPEEKADCCGDEPTGSRCGCQ